MFMPPPVIVETSWRPPTEAEIIARRLASHRKWARRRARLRLRRKLWGVLVWRGRTAQRPLRARVT